MKRVTHLLFGDGTVIESKTTESGQSVRLVRFDASETERLILADSLTPSKSSAPDEPTKTRKKPVRARKTDDEPISDKLLVPELDNAPTAESDVEAEETSALM
jgi:hypothetical protein